MPSEPHLKTNYVKFPLHNIVLVDDIEQMFGGSIISPRFVLTAGHCTQKTSPNNIIVWIGKHNLSRSEKGEQRIVAEKIIVHPKFEFIYNDYSLLKLSRPIDFGLPHVTVVCFPIKIRESERQRD